jgi:hypothetical protein
MGIFLEFLKVEMKEGILLMVTSLFIEQISQEQLRITRAKQKS